MSIFPGPSPRAKKLAPHRDHARPAAQAAEGPNADLDAVIALAARWAPLPAGSSDVDARSHRAVGDVLASVARVVTDFQGQRRKRRGWIAREEGGLVLETPAAYRRGLRDIDAALAATTPTAPTPAKPPTPPTPEERVQAAEEHLSRARDLMTDARNAPGLHVLFSSIYNAITVVEMARAKVRDLDTDGARAVRAEAARLLDGIEKAGHSLSAALAVAGDSGVVECVSIPEVRHG